MLLGVNNVQAVGHHCDGAASQVQGGSVGDAVNAQGETADDGYAGSRQLGGQGGRGLPSVGGGVAGPHHRHRPLIGWLQLSLDVQDRRWVANFLQPGRVTGVVPIQGNDAGSFQAGHLVVGRNQVPGGDQLAGHPVLDSGGDNLDQPGPPDIFGRAEMLFQPTVPDRTQQAGPAKGHPILQLIRVCLVHGGDNSTPLETLTMEQMTGTGFSGLPQWLGVAGGQGPGASASD